MRLLILDQFSDPGGAQQGLLELLPALRDQRWQVLLALPGEGELFERAREIGFRAERIDCGPYTSGRKSARDVTRFLSETLPLAHRISELAQQIRADLVYINGPRLLPAASLAMLRQPVLFHAHSYIGPGLIRRLAGGALRRMKARVLANCEFVAEPWWSFVSPTRVQVVYNGVGPANAPRLQTADPVVACIGRIAPEKGQLDFVQAAGEIHRVFPACRFHVIGAALFDEPGAVQYDRQVRIAAADLPIHFPGWIDDIYSALAGIDVLLVPSAPHEATTRVILEAYAAGVPVVAYRSGGIPEVVRDHQSGCLAGDAEQMAAYAIQLLADPARRQSMSQFAHDLWSESFTLDRYRAEMVHALESAVE